jgi:hypothetical protein
VGLVRAAIPVLIIVGAGGLVPATAPAAAPPNEEDVTGATTLRGRVTQAGGGAPIPDITVLISESPPGAEVGVLDTDPAIHDPAWIEQAEIDERGRFAVDVPRGMVRVTVLAAGFLRVDEIVDVGNAEASDKRRTWFLRRDVDALGYRTVVATDVEKVAPPVSSASLSREELESVPGSQGDALRGALNLPGVGRTPGGLGVLILRGNSPGRSRTYVGAHPVPHGFHFLSLSSIIPSTLLESVEVTPGNFDAAHDGSGGLTVIETRAPRRDGVHGSGRADLAAIGATVEGRLGPGSFAVGARRGWVDGVLGIANRSFDQNFLLPASWDYQALIDQPVGDATLRVRALGSSDALSFRFDDLATTGIKSAFEFRDDFHRLDAELTWRRDGWSLLLSPVARVDLSRWLDSFASALSESQSDRRRRDVISGVRAEARKRISRAFELRLGTELQLDWWRGRYEDQFELGDGFEGFDTEGTNRGSQHRLSSFADARLERGEVWATPGVRASAYTAGQETTLALDPRVVAGWRAHDRVELRAGAGLYSQPAIVRLVGVSPLVQDLVGGDPHLQLPPAFVNQINPTISLVTFDPDETESPIDRAIGVISNVQGSLGASFALPSDVKIDVTAFAQHDIPRGSLFAPELDPFSRFASSGWGGEVLIRKPLTRRFYGWIAYTLGWRRALSGDETVAHDFDQRHNLVFVASMKLPHRWRLGGRFRLASGYPLTPVIGADGFSAPIYGPINSERYPTFHQLDIRVDRRWVVDRATISAYLDVQNVYGVMIPEVFLYSADFRNRVGFGLPIFPAFGLDVRW